MIHIANKFLHYKEGTPQHKLIIDMYNNLCTPLPRGYKVKYSDSWCSVFVSVVAMMKGYNRRFYECSAERLYRQLITYYPHSTVLDDIHPNDIIFYDWTGNGWCDHVGIVTGVVGGNIEVIEGNIDDSVGVRHVHISHKFIKDIIHL